MVKISALPPISSLDPNDVTPGNDDSAGSTGKWSFSTLKTWLQSLTAWVTPAMRTGGFYVGTLSVTTTGNKVITGVGFQPKMVMFFLSTEATPSSSANAGISIGIATAAATRANIKATTRSSNGGSAYTETTKAFGIRTISAGGGSDSVNVDGDLVSFDSDGMTINVSTAVTGKTLVYVLLG